MNKDSLKGWVTMIDTHIHLNLRQYNKDLKEVINRAIEAGVNKIICIGMDYKTGLRALEIAEKYNIIYPTIGIHPTSVKDMYEGELDDIYDLLKRDDIVGVGECGIDLYWDKSNLDKQIEVFQKHIEWSIELDLPLVIHLRNSFEEAYEVMLPYKGKIKGVAHCFSGTYEEMMKLIDLGLYIGVDGPITFSKSYELRGLIKRVPKNRLVIETDGPYLTPSPYRGKRNEPAYLKYIAEEVAKVWEMDLEDAIKITSHNAQNLFPKIRKEK